jgi:hypothetical protein
LHLENFKGEADSGIVYIILDDDPGEAVFQIDLGSPVDIIEKVLPFKQLMIALPRPSAERRRLWEEV